MNHRVDSNMRRLLFLFACFLISTASAKAQSVTGGPQTIEPQPIFEQCAALKSGSSRNDAATHVIATLKGKDSKARAQAARWLGQSCDKRAVAPLIDLLKDEDPLVRLTAVEALGKLGDRDSVEPLIDSISDKDWRVRLALVSALASFKTFRARNSVLNLIANPSGADISDVDDMRVRCAAILTVNQLNDVSYSGKAVLLLYGFLESRHAAIRQLAEQTLFALKNTRNGPSEFNAILKQNSAPMLRRWAAVWIGKIGIESAQAVLEEVSTSDSDPGVRQAAIEALALLKGGTRQ